MSARNCMLSRSFNFVSLASEKSKFLKSGPTKALRPRFPKWKPPAHTPFTGSQSHGAAKAPRFSNLLWPPVPAKGFPTTSGRSKNSLLLLKSSNEFRLNGCPLERRSNPFTDQPLVKDFAVVGFGNA